MSKLRRRSQSGPIVLEGRFQLWTYDISHGLMLLRRNPDANLKRAEILFSDVRAIEIETSFEDLRIEIVPACDAPSRFKESEWVTQPGLLTFKLTSKTWTGFVCAGSAAYLVDDRQLGDPSIIYKPGGLMKRLAADGYLLD